MSMKLCHLRLLHAKIINVLVVFGTCSILFYSLVVVIIIIIILVKYL
jgi:hypothetical protein